jgi:hypothetical protein
LYWAFYDQLGHPPSQAEESLLRTAATLAAGIEIAAREVAKGRWSDPDATNKASNNLRRTLEALRLTDTPGAPAKGGSASDLGDLLGAPR